MAVAPTTNPISYLTRRQYGQRDASRADLFASRMANARNLFRKDLLSHYGCVNAIEFSNEGELLISGNSNNCALLAPYTPFHATPFWITAWYYLWTASGYIDCILLGNGAGFPVMMGIALFDAPCRAGRDFLLFCFLS